MLRANFFFRFFNYKQNSSSEIVQYKSNENSSLTDQINTKILEIDQKISENRKDLIEAQIVQFRSMFARSNNFIEQIGKNVYKTKLDKSINWHQKQLKELYLRRRDLQIKLEKVKGIFWLNQLKRFLRVIFIGFFILFCLFIFFSGFIIIIYLLPVIILIYLGNFLSNKRN
tara:strand:- start:487 stop:999 length:513 start_codon:yes stop_codon:yes gene_type:complete